LLSQSGTSAPTAVVLENTLGVVPTYGYSFSGIYTVNSTDLFTTNKTACIVSNSFDVPNGLGVMTIPSYPSDDVITLTSIASDGGSPNDTYVNTLIIIYIYP
jgi:hypothetical protein